MIAIPLAVSDQSFIPVKMGEKFLKTKLSQEESVGFIENAKKNLKNNCTMLGWKTNHLLC